MKKAFENELVRALMRLDIDLWSDTVKVNMQPQILSDDFDDNMGNTNIAIVVLNKSFLADKVCVQKLKTLLKYKTIDIFWILNKTESTFACEMLKNDIDDIENLLEQGIVYDAEEGISNIATDLGLNIFSMKKNTGERISTGINALDYLLNGGLIKGSSINIIGSSGTGKTTLSVQIQKNVLESGLACLYITYSEAPRNILQRFKDLGCDIKKYIQEGKFKIYEICSAVGYNSSQYFSQAFYKKTGMFPTEYSRQGGRKNEN